MNAARCEAPVPVLSPGRKMKQLRTQLQHFLPVRSLFNTPSNLVCQQYSAASD